MPVYEYKGLNKTGRNVKGTIDADSSRSAKVRLKKDGIFVVDLKDKTKSQKKSKSGKTKSAKSVSVTEISMMTRQLATLIKANIPLVDALAAVADQVENPSLSAVISEIKNSVNEGGTFYKSLGRYPNIFNKIYISMVEAGEVSGTLDVILIRLAEFTEAQAELNSKVKSALLYPAIMFFFTGIMLAVLFIFVIPKITEVFESSPDFSLAVVLGDGH